MTKLRRTFALVAILGAVTFGALIAGVHWQVEAERRAAQRALAERVFDEMERGLTEILQREDARSRRGLRTTDEEAAYGYFELYGEDDALAFLDDPRATARTEVRRRTFASTRGADVLAETILSARRDEGGQRPGTTVALDGSAFADEPVFRAMAALNRGAQLREHSADGYEFGAYDVRAAGEHVAVFRPLARWEHAGSRRERWRVGHTEGIVLERRALRDHLARRVLGEGESFAFDLAPVADRRSPARSALFRHRFAEPFDDLEATLTPAPLASAQSATVLYAFAALLVVALIAALLAAYRTAAARVRFAERQERFVSAVTHELRTPLTTLRMYSEMLREGIVPPEAQREYHDAMVSESERLGRLVENVLAKSRLTKPSASPQPIELRPSIDAALRILAPQAQARGFELTASIDEPLPLVRGDADAITQVVLNLVDNALVHAGPSTERRVIELACAWRDDGVVLGVRDYGRGVPEELLEDVFEPFVSGSAGPGVGLGLALVRALVARMGGIVFAENADGGGLRVTAVLQAA